MSTCSICMELVGAIDSRGNVGQLVSTECKHIYHEACLSRWMKRSPTCPECKAEQKCKPVRLRPEVQNLEDHLLPHDLDTVAGLLAEIADVEKASGKIEAQIESVETTSESLAEECRCGEMRLENLRGCLRRTKRERQTAEEKVYTVEHDMQMKLEELRQMQDAVKMDMPLREPRSEMRQLRDNIVNNRNIDVLIRAVEVEWKQLLDTYRQPGGDLESLTMQLNELEEELQEARTKCRRSPVGKRKRVGLTAHERVMKRGLERQLSRGAEAEEDQSVLQRMRTLVSGGKENQSSQSNGAVLKRHATRVVDPSQSAGSVKDSVVVAAPLPKLKRTATEASSDPCPLEDLLGDLLEIMFHKEKEERTR
ncbi:Myosin heavy chain, clone, putative [Perkinsus marinus ATCC 50983]|uniref:Myosin heavy chain, clone, putative n=1 Tax=Perkinsus marinus (strain ATCC 50983 / TXsc) TaxID=423536 RepID=C5KKN6_PERM5|nr:Myosin heavy chain, clone, putative [Perkinsus marinus ATCC 50983]EER15148.1 Myosin heavy chain, clone, putative [Perkinsus marinus ATCC 50983]|eukprot:XP_002783352.1 Myosin heavy chain, clone, putative [Perkinsus marinus ATCC 50983]